MAQVTIENPWIHRIFGVVVTILLGISAYFLNDTATSIKVLDSRISRLELTQAELVGGGFTKSDWQISKAFLDSDRLVMEKRVTTVETTIPQIKDILTRIEKSIDAVNQRIEK
jgi:hypothetical protein